MQSSPARCRAFPWPGLVAMGVLLSSAVAWAQTPVSGTIDRSTTWSVAGSPYVLSGDVEVVGGATLTILAGVDVRFEPASRLLIGGEQPGEAGRLLVVGSSSDRVEFGPAAAGTHAGGVELRPGAAAGPDGSGSAIRFARFDVLGEPLTMRGAVAELFDVVVFRATNPERPAVVVELDRLSDEALRATRLQVIDSAGPGMVITKGGSHELVGCRFVANNGRGLWIDMNPGFPRPRAAREVRLDACEFIANRSGRGLGGGGALLLGEAAWIMVGCTFLQNSSEGSGGGLYLQGLRDSSVRACEFVENASAIRGGGMLASIYDILIEDCRFRGNGATNDGGGIGVQPPSRLHRCVFEANTAAFGGAAYGPIMAVDCRFTDNSARISGGAMQIQFTTTGFGVVGGVFEGNSAVESGGAIDFWNSTAREEVRIEGASFVDNSADFGGAIGNIGGRPVEEGFQLRLVATRFEANLARRGGAIHVRTDAVAGLRLDLSPEGDAVNRFSANLATTGSAIANDSAHGVEASGVCWGVPTASAARTLIHDGLDDPALGIVAIDPIATACLDCPQDLDGDGELTIFDFLIFQGLFAIGDPAADFDGDGEFTIFDFLGFSNAFDAGCS